MNEVTFKKAGNEWKCYVDDKLIAKGIMNMSMSSEVFDLAFYNKKIARPTGNGTLILKMDYKEVEENNQRSDSWNG